MRKVARLLKEVHQITLSKEDFSAYIHPRYFDSFVEATRNLGKKSTQLALVIGHCLKQLCQLHIAQAIKEGNDEKEKLGEKFLKLFIGQWTTMVSSAMGKKQRLDKLNKTTLLPKSIDLVQLTSWLKEEVERQLEDLTDYFKLVKLAVSSLILFNSRRPMEVAEIKVEDFKRSLEFQEEQEEIVKSLSVEEKLLANR